MRKLKVAIDFRVDDPRQGAGTSVLALAHGLSRLRDEDQEYVFIVNEAYLPWIQPHVSGPCSVVAAPRPTLSKLARVKAQLRKVTLLRRLWLRSLPTAALIPRSDGFIESLGCDLVHFPCQIARLTESPSIYQPWDLQHRHYPEFFAPEDVLLRNIRYSAFCHKARFVCIQTEWGKQDLVREFDLDPAKIVVIRWGTAFEAYQPLLASEMADARARLALPPEFFLYPAVTWPHKNHELILHALRELRAVGRPTHVVFTGASTPHRKHLDALVRQMGLQAQVHFLGFVTSQELQAIYQLATAMIFPSRFEGLGLPILEAFRVGLPVLCSSATVLPEVVGQAALLFNPDSPADLRAAIKKVQSPQTRARLIAEGTVVLKQYSADKAAREFATLYRATAGDDPNRSVA